MSQTCFLWVFAYYTVLTCQICRSVNSIHGRGFLFDWFLPGANVPFWHLPTSMLLQIRDIRNPETSLFGLKSIGVNVPVATDFYRHQIKLEVTQIARESHSRSSVAASNGERFKTFSNTTWTEQSWAWTWPVHPVLLRAILRYTLGVQWSRDCFQ